MIFSKIEKLTTKFLDNNKVLNYVNLLLSCLAVLYLIDIGIKNNVSIEIKIQYLLYIPIIWITYFLYAYGWSQLIKPKFDILIIKIWFLSVLGKYLPLKVGIPLMRMTNFKEDFNEFNVKKNISTIIIEQLIIIFWGVIFGLAFFLTEYINPYIYLGIVYISAITIIFLLKSKLTYKKYFINTNIALMTGQLFTLIFFSLLYSQILGEIKIENVLAYYLSSVLAVVLIGAPVGIGVREFLYIQILNFETIPSEIFNFMVIVRLVYLINDLVVFLFVKFLTSLNIQNQKY